MRVVPGPDSSPEKLRYIYNVTNMTETTMTLKLGFENPIEVSADDIDSLNITFNDHSYFQATSGEAIKKGTVISKKIPSQMSNSKMAPLMAEIEKFLTPSLSGFNVATLFLNMLLAATLQQLWGMINAQQIIVHMIAYKTKPPAITTWFFHILFQIQSVDVIPWGDLYSYLFTMEHTEPLSKNLYSLGFINRYFICNLGSSILPIALIAIFLVLWFLFSRCKNIRFFRFLSEKLEKWLF